jgi:heterodisulfide reductase subunit A-like polyferredoxin
MMAVRFGAALVLGAVYCTALPTTREWIEKDVCIIGGGASGTYAAVRLQQMGVDVALIEKEAKLGGRPI